MKIAYKLEDGTKNNKNTWVIPNRDETHWGLVRIVNLMDYFVTATGGNTPILIKDAFNSSGFCDEEFYAITVNGKKKIVCDEINDMWQNAFQELSIVTNSNLNKVPAELYQFHLFWIPLKQMTKTKIKREDFMKKKKKNEEEVISISSLASLDEEKLMKSRNAMILFFLWKKKSMKDEINFKNKQKYAKFSIKLEDKQTENKICTKFLIQALHDISDIFGSHHEKIYNSINDLIDMNQFSKEFIDSVNRPEFKREHSV